MAIAPVKKGSHTFRECIPGHRSRQLFNYQRDIFEGSLRDRFITNRELSLPHNVYLDHD
jgi:hypothetical protein